MIKLKAFILTEGRTEQISMSETLDILITKNPSGLSGLSIFRGVRELHAQIPAAFVKPSEYTRRSANTTNYYTTLLDNLPSWQKYPKRSKSIICTTDFDRAEGYSYNKNTFYVFPAEGSKVGICPQNDIWKSFKEFDYENWEDLSIFNISMNSLLKIYGNLTKNYYVDDSNYNAMLEAFDYITEHKQKIYDAAEILSKDVWYGRNIILDVWKRPRFKTQTFFDFINKSLLNPDYNDFKLQTYNNNFIAQDEKELWTDGDSVLINYDYIGVIEKKIGMKS